MITALGERVVIERTITQKKRKVQVEAKDAASDIKVVDKVISIGDGVPETWPVELNTPVIVFTYAKPEGMIDMSPDPKDKFNKVYHGIISYEEVVGIYGSEDIVPHKKQGAIINQ